MQRGARKITQRGPFQVVASFLRTTMPFRESRRLTLCRREWQGMARSCRSAVTSEGGQSTTVGPRLAPQYILDRSIRVVRFSIATFRGIKSAQHHFDGNRRPLAAVLSN